MKAILILILLAGCAPRKKIDTSYIDTPEYQKMLDARLEKERGNTYPNLGSFKSGDLTGGIDRSKFSTNCTTIPMWGGGFSTNCN